jgi:hypothetical protein
MPVADHIDNLPRVANFTPAAQAGPFPLPFPIYAADDQAELKSDFLVALDGVVQTDFTVAGTFINGVALDGTITFGAPLTGNLTIFSRRRPRSTVDLSAGQAVTTEELQAIVNGVIATQRDIFDFLLSLEAGTVLPAGTFVPTAGGAMTGFLDLVADPTTDLKAATKKYVDDRLTSTTKGDLGGHDGLSAVRVPVGGDGKRLIADSSQASGLAYARNGGTLQTLIDAANISWDMDLGDDAKVTLGANRTLSAPINQAIGQSGYLDVVMDATGGRTLTFDPVFHGIDGSAPNRPDPHPGHTTRYLFSVRAVDDIILVDVPSPFFESELAADQTNNTIVLASITALEIPMLANTNYKFVADLHVQQPASGAGIGFRFDVNGPAAPSLVNVTAAFFDTGDDVVRADVFTAYGVLGTTRFNNASQRDGMVHFEGLIQNGPNAGNFQIRFRQGAVNAGAPLRIFKGSNRIFRLAR